MSGIANQFIGIAAIAIIGCIGYVLFGSLLTDMWTQTTDQMALVNMVFGA